MIRHRSFARVGLLGNPSDVHFGKCLSFTFRQFSAAVSCEPAERVEIVPGRPDALAYDTLDALVRDVRRRGYYGGVRLIKATLLTFREHCRAKGRSLREQNPGISYESDIPVHVGLAGSSAIVTAALGALSEFYEVPIGKPTLANLALRVEALELGIPGGLMDRVVQVYGGLVFMDLSRSEMERSGHGRYEALDSELLPPLFVAYRPGLAEESEAVHRTLRRRVESGDREVRTTIGRLAELAQRGRDMLLEGRGGEIGPLMEENFALRTGLGMVEPANRELALLGRREGAAVKLAGSGGAVVGLYDGDPARLERLRAAYSGLGATLLVPEVAEGSERRVRENTGGPRDQEAV